MPTEERAKEISHDIVCCNVPRRSNTIGCMAPSATSAGPGTYKLSSRISRVVDWPKLIKLEDYLSADIRMIDDKYFPGKCRWKNGMEERKKRSALPKVISVDWR